MTAMNSTLFQKIVENSFVGVVVVDKKTSACDYCNTRAREVLTRDGSAFSLNDLVADGLRDGQRTISTDMLRNGGTYEDIFLKKGDGALLIVQAHFVSLSPDQVLFMFQDMTFQKKLQREVMTKQNEIFEALREMEKQNADLRGLDKAKDRFIALISHELRTPISAIVATAQFVHDGLADSPEEILQHMDVVLDEGNHLLEMVNDILDFQKIHMGKVELYVEETEIETAVKHGMHNMEKFAQTRATELVLESIQGYPKVFCDPVRMAQVFYNILSNAIKFSPEKSKVVIRGQHIPERNCVEISFQDFGAGIPKDQEQKVFNEFETIENIRTHHKGTGLGMPICKRLMESMGGRIYFKSELGTGSTFFVEIPTNKVLEPDKYRKRSASGDLAA